MKLELNKLDLNNKLDCLIAIDILYSRLYRGWVCPKCGIIQGESRKGVDEYYCEHTSEEVDRLLEPMSKKLTQEVLEFTIKNGAENGDLAK